MMRILLVSLLLLISFAYAQEGGDILGGWLSTTVIALLLAVFILALLFMVAKGFELRDLSIVATEELYQIITSAIMLAVLIPAYIAMSSPTFTFDDGQLPQGLDRGPYSIMDAARLSITTASDSQSVILSDLQSVGRDLGAESSKSYFCSLAGVGFSINSCASFRALTAPVSMAFQALSISITELSVLGTLLGFAQNYSFVMLLPFGILLRSFKFSRGAGAFLFSLAVSLYLVVPFTALFMSSLVHGYESSPGIARQESSLSGLEVRTCDENGNNCGVQTYTCDEEDIGIGNAKSSTEFLRQSIEPLREYTYLFLFKSTLVLIVVLVAFTASMRAISRLAGADVDVTALMRLS